MIIINQHCIKNGLQYSAINIYFIMNLENIQKVEILIKERNSITEFLSKIIENRGERILHLNDVKFEAEFLRPIYSQKFVEEINSKVEEECGNFIKMIDEQLKEL